MTDIESIVIEVRREGVERDDQIERYKWLPPESRSCRFILSDGEELRIEIEQD